LADQNFRVKHGIGIGTNTFADANRNINAGIATLRHAKVTGITTVGIISAVDGNGAQGIVTFQSRIGISSNGNQITISPPSAGAGFTGSYEIILPPRAGTDGQTLTIGPNGQLGFTTAGLYENRLYVSAANGDDINDGRALPVKTIKKAAQLASFRSFNLPAGRFIDAGNLLNSNREFIQNEVVSYLEFSYPNITTDKPDYDRTTCIRDVGLIVDAIVYDLSYGGNSKTVEAALSYWSGGVSSVAGEEEEALFAYQYIGFISQYIINNQTPPTLYQTAVGQVFDYTIIQDPNNVNANYFHRRKDARNRIVANRQEIIDKSLAAVAIAHSDFYFPGEQSTNIRSRFYDAYRLIQQNRQTIINYAYAGIATAYPSFVQPNPAKCQRDLGMFVDAVSTDVFTGGNSYAREFVFKYFNGVGINSLAGEEQETIYAFRSAGTLMNEALTNRLPITDLSITADPATGSNTSASSCANVRSAVDTLVGIVTTTIGAGSTAGITTANNGFFAGITTSCNVVCGSIGIGSTNIIGGRKCARDLGQIVDAIAQDVSYGSNQHIVYATKRYFNGAGYALTTGLLNEESESITAFVAARDYAKKAIANQLNSQDFTIIADPVTGFNTDPASCANIQTSIDNIVGILTVAIGNSSLSAVPAPGIGTITDCANVRSAVVSYVGIITSVIGIGTTAAPNVTNPSTKSEPIAIIVEAGDYVEDNPILLYEDVAVLGDNLRNTIIRPSNAGKDLFRVRNGGYITNFAMKDFVDQAGIPQFTFDNGLAFDDPADSTASRVGYATKNTKPVITRSPYIQNCSIISFLGANGILVDGSKVASPNTPIIKQEVENPVEQSQPEQGKSMVAAAYTMVSFGGIGWRCINEGYAQVVSCFQIFCKYGSLCQSGGYLSITNSATNFGLFALRAVGWSPNSFRFDRGRIAATGISGGLQTLKVIGLGRTDQDLYVTRFYNNANVDQTSSFKPITTQQQFNATTGINTSTDRFLITNHPFSNQDIVLYTGDEGAIPPSVIGGLVSGNQYYLSYIDQNTFELYEDNSLIRRVNLTSPAVGIHTFTKGNLEFFVSEVLDTHAAYQSVGIASTTSTLNFVSGRTVQQTVPGGTAVGFALTYLSESRQLIVSVEASAGVRRLFGVTNNVTTLKIADHSGSPVSIAVTSVTGITTYRTTEFKVASTPSGTVVSNIATLPENYQLFFHRPSIINSSGHTWEYSGSGTDYNALPQNGGQTDPASEQIFELGGRVYSSGTNELGDFKIGAFITAFNRTGNIVFNNKVSIGVLASLKLSLSGGVEIEAFSTDIGLGDNEVGGSQDTKVSTQKAIRTFLNNRLGSFIDRNLTTNAVPSAVVQLNATGQINADLIPPKVVNYYRANVSGGRTDLVNLIPATNLQNGDTVIEPGNGYVLISDVYGQYLILSSDTTNYNFNNGDTVVSANSAGGAVGIVTGPPINAVGYGTTGLVKGVLLGVTVTSGGSGYTNPGVYTCVLDTNTGIGTSARAAITVGAAGTVTQVRVNFGGRKYVSGDTLTINDDSLIGGRVSGSRFSATVNDLETRLYLTLTNNQKFTGSTLLPDYIADGNAVAISTDTSVGYGKTFEPTDTSIGGDVDFANDRIIVGVTTFTNGDPVIYSSNNGNLVGGLTQSNTYYIKRVGVSSVELYTSYALATKVDFTSSGTGSHSLTRVGVNTSEEHIIFVNHGYTTGDAVRASGTTPTGITTGAFYFVGSITQNAFTLHETRADALTSVNGLTLGAAGIANTNGGVFSLTKQNVTYNATINTSSAIFDNFTVLSSASIDASNVTTGTISPSRLGSGSASDTTFLAGDSSYKKVVTSVGIGTTQPLSATATTSDSAPGGVGINTYYGKVELKVNRAAGTPNLYSTLGVAKFKTSTFSVDADGAVSIKPSATGDVDAATLGGVSGAYFLDPANFTGNISITRGGTGLSALPSLGAILQGNGLSYDLVTTPVFYGNVTITNNSKLEVLGIAATNISVTGATGIATFQNFKVTNEVVSGVSTFSGSGNNINQTAGTAALNRLTVTGVTTVGTLFFDSLGGTSGASIPYMTNINAIHSGIVTFTSAENNIQQQAGTAELNNLTVAGVSTFVSLTNFGTANFGTVDISGTLVYANSQTSGVSTFSGTKNNINQTAGTAALNRLTVAGVSTVARLEQSSNETSDLQRLTVAGISTFTGQLNAGTVSASNFTGSLNNTLTIQSPLTGNSYNNSAAVTIGINATNANTANYVVQRGASGEFSMGALTATSATLQGLLTTQSIAIGADHDISFTTGTWTGEKAGKIQFHGNNLYLQFTGSLVGRNASAIDVFTLGSSGNASFNGAVTATTFTSTVTTATGAPFTVSSTTKVTNLNADLLDGLDTSSSNVINTVVTRDATGAFSAGAITGTSLIGSLNNTLTIQSPLTGNSYNNSAAVTIGINATNANTANYVVQRDASGNFSAGTITANLTGNITNTVTGTNSTELVRGNMADNDQFRILIGGTSSNAGFVEIATADDGTEPIHVRQYTGVFSSLQRTATLLDESGNTSFPGNVTASGTITGTQFISNVTGATAPFVVSSTTQVNNLNAALLNGFASTSDNNADTIVRRNNAGGFSAGTITATTFSGNLANTLTLNTFGTGLSGAATYNNSGGLGVTFTVTSNATSANTGGAIVARDASGNFIAGTITANLAGNATTATNATGSTFSGDAVNVSNINNRIDSGFYEHDSPTTGEGWPLNGSWMHLISSTHSNNNNYFAMQFAASFFNQTDLFYRSVNNNGNTAWSRIWHSGNDGSGSGLDADTLDGLELHTGTNNEANKVVRTQGNGYIMAGWINSISGNMGDSGNGVNKYYCSNDDYIRYIDRNAIKVQLGLTGKYDADRRDFTSDGNYFVGTMGWGTTDLNSVMTWGSGFFDTWSNPANQPSGTSHWVGVQAYHYVNAYNSGYGWQMCGGPIGNLRFRNSWPNNSGWTTVAMHDRNDGSGGGLFAGIYYDANNTGFYVDPASSSNLNESLTTNDYFARSWIRNNNSGSGLYNQATGQHWYSDAGNWWNVGANGNGFGIRLRHSYNGTIAGYLYGQYDNNFGLLSNDGNWQVRINNSEVELYDITYWNDGRGYIFYDRNNTGYNSDPDGVSRFNDTRVNILYDFNDTGWYVDPNGTTRLNRIRSPGTFNNTASGGANIRMTAAENDWVRAVSSIKYKKDVEDLEDSYVDNMLDNVRPVWYRSKCKADPEHHGFYGFIAEEVAEVDIRLVGLDENNEPEYVQYDQFVPHLVNLARRQRTQLQNQQELIDQLMQRVAALEAK